MAPLVDYLVAIGAAPVGETAKALTPIDVLMERYTRYLAEERGLSVVSIHVYEEVARAFLNHTTESGELHPERLTTAQVTEFVLAESRRCKVASAKAMTTRLRALLRFLYLEGLTPIALAGAVPSVASWRLTSLPKALPPEEVTRLLKSCDRRTAVGRRDFAVLMVLSRLGLRAGEVAGLQLSDIDWRRGELVIRGKANREDRLPLPVDVGEAIVGWLTRGRPHCASQAVFIRVRAPQRGLGSTGVSTIVMRACDRVGRDRVGAHRLRHTAATEMLRAGGSLVEVGQVLRHHGRDVTSIYAKVDRKALAAVVRPWPGSAS
jgi:site-specific recombinase XerD